MKNDFIKNNQGFTLLEILLSLSIFSILVFAVSSVYIAFNNSQMRTTVSQQLLNDSQYALELMAREIRNSSIVYPLSGYTHDNWCERVMGTWADLDDCIILKRENGQVFAFTSYRYVFANTDLRYVTLNNCGDDYSTCDNWKNDYMSQSTLLAVKLNDINIESLDFVITPDEDPFENNGPNQQPKVTIKMTTAYSSQNIMKDVQNTFQTTVSSRIYKR